MIQEISFGAGSGVFYLISVYDWVERTGTTHSKTIVGYKLIPKY